VLVLTRKSGAGDQSGVVLVLEDGRRILIQVLECRTHRVQLGIEAPDGVRVDRAEVHERRQQRAERTP